jgi:hypothetical protein
MNIDTDHPSNEPANEPPTLPKPNELLALHDVTTELFNLLQRWFTIGPTVTLNLEAVDSAFHELGDPTLIAAMAMRKLQALHLLSMPGVRTTTDVVVTIVQDLDRALIQAPSMRLNLAASTTDWDAALAALDTSDEDLPQSVDDGDAEADRFAELHGKLHEAVFAVLNASENEIRYFV